VFFYPLSSLPMFIGHVGGTLAIDIPTRAFNLPSFHEMQDAEQNRVAAVVHRVVAKKRAGS
jgi:perosamine synthetase